MEFSDDRIKDAVNHTEILRSPKQSLYTFGVTSIHYYLVTKPAYSEMVPDVAETVVREGKVVAQKPKIVTPYYLSRLEGFSSEARKYFETLVVERGSDISGLFYTYSNEPKGLTIISENLLSVVDKLNAEIDEHGDPLAAIIKGEDELWDVSLLKFIYEMTSRSFRHNLMQMGSRGLLNMDAAGIPQGARAKIEELFAFVSLGKADPGELKTELDRWGLFEEYQDRFFNIFRKKR